MRTQYTKSTSIKDIERAWHHFDVKGEILGRIATRIALALIGKSKKNFVRHLDCGDFVVVTNARYVAVTGRKEDEKLYGKYSGYPGGLKQKPLKQIRIEKPTEIIRQAVYGMLPKNKLRDRLITRLYVYEGEDHPYKDRFVK